MLERKRKGNDSNELLREVRSRKRIFQRKMIKWARENLRDFPWRDENRTPYSVLVAEVLLKRTTSTAVLRVYNEFLEAYPNIRQLANADRIGLERLLLSIGYYKLRAIGLIEMADYVVKNYGGEIPASKESLLKVPHIGSYTAGAILSFGYGIPSEIVDSNVERIIRRFFHSKLPDKASLRIIQKIAKELLPSEHHEVYNWALLDLGALVCRYDKPRHEQCPLESICDYPKLGSERIK